MTYDPMLSAKETIYEMNLRTYHWIRVGYMETLICNFNMTEYFPNLLSHICYNTKMVTTFKQTFRKNFLVVEKEPLFN